MFRISHYMQLLSQPPPDTIPAARQPSGPVVIWNLIRRCNLTCKHCYSISADIDFPGELSTTEIYAVMDDLKRFGVPVLILSGGEPLLRPDIYDISARARAMGFYVGLSSNGTLIDADNIERIASIGYDYVGISLDGMRATHDRFRQKQGAFDASLAAIRLCRDAGIKVGMRFTPTQDTAHELPDILRLMDAEGVDKLYVSHLNYGGRGNRPSRLRRHPQHHPAGHGPAVRRLLDRCAGRRQARVRHRQQRRRCGLPAALGGAPPAGTPCRAARNG